MASNAKKARYSLEIFEEFAKEESNIKALKAAFDDLCSSKSGALVSLTINQCNAAYGIFGKPGKPFSSADVDVKVNSGPGDTLYYFGTVFQKGFDVLLAYLKNPLDVPEENYMRHVLAKLLTYINNKGDHQVLKAVEACGKLLECDLAVRFAQHLFSKLGASSTFTLDQFYHSRTAFTKCLCGCQTDVLKNYGDTSIGNPKIWHGCIDIILDGSFVPVKIIEDEDEPDSPGRKSSIEVKNKENLEDYDVTSQLISQTIVFSFTQKKNHPEFQHFLIPTIGIEKNSVIFHFYDSEHDILLKSPAFPIFDDSEVSVFSILAIWFVVNYKYLCSGITEEILNKSPKADFFKHAEKQLSIYQSEVSIGGVLRGKQSIAPYQPWFLTRCDFGAPPKSSIKDKKDDES